MVDKKRSIVFVNQATGYLTIDIINAFADSGKFLNIALLAGSIRTQDIPLNSSVEWVKTILYNRGNPRKKFMSWFLGSLQIGWHLATRFRKYEVFYITIPPFAYLWSLLLPNRFSILVFDVYPDVLKIYNISESNVLYRIWCWANARLFRKAYRLYTLGDGMMKLLSKYTSKKNITVIYNWSGLTKMRPISRSENFFLTEHNIENKFVVQYSGNIGYTHNVEVLVELAKLMKDESGFFFLIIGRGERYNEIKQQVDQEGLLNCKLLPFQPDEILNYTLAAADLGVVMLDDKIAHVSIPSKIYNLQAVGVPILGIANTTSELAIHLQRHNNGKCFERTDLSFIRDYIQELRNNSDKMNQLKVNSALAAKSYTSANALLYLQTYV